MDIILIRGRNIPMKLSTICVSVISGDTFYTNRSVKMRLARVNVPSVNTREGQFAKELLESLILSKFITYNTTGEDIHGTSVVEVWVDSRNINDAMRNAGYREAETSSCGMNTEEELRNTQKTELSSP
jgi:endonuclease YncB( thermonuclease family)